MEHFLEEFGNLLALVGFHPSILFGRNCAVVSAAFFEKLPGRNRRPDKQGRTHRPGGGKGQFVAAGQLLELVQTTSGTSEDWLVIKMALEVPGQAIGRLVAAGAVLFQRLHDDPIEIPAHQVDEFGRIGLAMCGSSGQLAFEHRA